MKRLILFVLGLADRAREGLADARAARRGTGGSGSGDAQDVGTAVNERFN
jgi:hypothetical protein